MMLPRFRFTVRRLMIAVAISGLAIWASCQATAYIQWASLPNPAHSKATPGKFIDTHPVRDLAEARELQFRRAWEAARPAPTPVRPDDDAPEPDLTETDGHVLDALLGLLAEDHDFHPAMGRGGTRLILLSEAGKLRRWVAPEGAEGGRWADVPTGEAEAEWGLSEPDGIPDTAARREVASSWARRNTKRDVPLGGLQPSHPAVSVGVFDPAVTHGHRGFEAKYPDAKGYVAASLPGYTRDGRTAYVSFFSGPGGIHGGPSGEFLFAYREGRWTLIWRRMSQAM